MALDSHVVVVLFTIPGCEACEEYKPRFRRIAQHYQNQFPIFMLDANDPKNADLATRLNVMAVPASFVLRRPTGMVRVEGAIPDQQIAWLFGLAAREAATGTHH